MSCYNSPSAAEHRECAPTSVGCAVLTVSDTRTLADDKSGAQIVERLEAAGHRIAARSIVKDETNDVAGAVREFLTVDGVDAVLITGGTGIAARDQTPEALRGMFTKELPGFGELFRMLSYQEIGAAAMLSRAIGGVVNGKIVLLMPGSTAAVRLAMDKLVVPELGHLVKHARR
jgi:molybdenum cofactor biosynthesis protein B